MFDFKYLSQEHLKGFKNYKYSAVDTSPISRYVMHPTWNFLVKFIPPSIAPNLLTFAGFLCLLFCAVLFHIFDYNFTSAGGGQEGYRMPNVVYTICSVLLFLAYHLDGVDGKQARKIGVSGPLGELFDHGIDTTTVFFIPFCLISVFGRDEFSLPLFRGYLIVMSVILNFYVSHWEKYNTGTLYLPWGYDVSMWFSSILFLVAGVKGPEVFKTYIYEDYTFTQALEVLIHLTGLFTTLPVAIYNVHLSYKNKTGRMYSLSESLRPVWPITSVFTVLTIWATISPNDVLNKEPRMFLLLLGTLFSHVACRLIVTEISEQRSEAINLLFWPLLGGAVFAVNQPEFELTILYGLFVFCLAVHLHYSICVVSSRSFPSPASEWWLDNRKSNMILDVQDTTIARGSHNMDGTPNMQTLQN